MAVIASPPSKRWEQVLRADEANQEYFAQRFELPGVALFFSERADAPEFDSAWIYRVRPECADETIQTIADLYHQRGRTPRVRLSPVSTPADWPLRLQQAGFAHTDDRLAYFAVPEKVRLTASAAIRVTRAVSRADADSFSAVQVAGFGIPPQHQGWDRELARRHVVAGRYAFYLAWLDGQAVGAARSVHLPDGATALAALATIPQARRRGVGTGLLARMIDDARRIGSCTICGTTIPESYAAGLYSRLGFVHLFEVQTFVASDQPHVAHGVCECRRCQVWPVPVNLPPSSS